MRDRVGMVDKEGKEDTEGTEGKSNVQEGSSRTQYTYSVDGVLAHDVFPYFFGSDDDGLTQVDEYERVRRRWLVV